VLDATSASGKILLSLDSGTTWQTMLSAKPVVWVATDPSNSQRLYAAVANHAQSLGGIYFTSNLSALTQASWLRIPSPARTEGHPATITVLNDGKVVCTFSGRRDAAGAFTASSGVFVYNPTTLQWTDASSAGMQYWTKDLVLDPSDANQNTWYVCVYSGWGGAPNGTGGIYRTTNRGTAWTKICALDRVSSLTFDPANSNTAYICTESEGLWVSQNISATVPTFSRVADFPFKHPERVFFRPNNPNEMWVATFGNGMQMCKKSTQTIVLDSTWNMFSISVLPETANLPEMFTPAPAYKFLINSGGTTYNHGVSFAHNPASGYMIYSSKRDTLTVSGYELIASAVAIHLHAGWNLVPYLPRTAQPVATVFSALGTNLIAVLNDKGEYYLPAWGINSISGGSGILQPSESYRIFVVRDCIFRYKD
jgi:hypothetical protein